MNLKTAIHIYFLISILNILHLAQIETKIFNYVKVEQMKFNETYSNIDILLNDNTTCAVKINNINMMKSTVKFFNEGTKYFTIGQNKKNKNNINKCKFPKSLIAMTIEKLYFYSTLWAIRIIQIYLIIEFLIGIYWDGFNNFNDLLNSNESDKSDKSNESNELDESNNYFDEKSNLIEIV